MPPEVTAAGAAGDGAPAIAREFIPPAGCCRFKRRRSCIVGKGDGVAIRAEYRGGARPRLTTRWTSVLGAMKVPIKRS